MKTIDRDHLGVTIPDIIQPDLLMIKKALHFTQRHVDLYHMNQDNLEHITQVPMISPGNPADMHNQEATGNLVVTVSLDVVDNREVVDNQEAMANLVVTVNQVVVDNREAMGNLEVLDNQVVTVNREVMVNREVTDKVGVTTNQGDTDNLVDTVGNQVVETLEATVDSLAKAVYNPVEDRTRHQEHLM